MPLASTCIPNKKQYDNWKSYGIRPKKIFIPILITLIPVGVLIYLMLSNPFAINPIYKFGNNSIAYESSISVAEVTNLSNELFNMNIITKESKNNFIIKNRNNSYELYLPIAKEYLNTEDVDIMLKQIENKLNESKSFKKTIVVVEADENFKRIK